MQTKLTLRLDDAVIRRAKAWAHSRGISLSEAVATIFAQLPDDVTPQTGPWTRRLIGAGGVTSSDTSDAETRQQYRDYVEQKYR